MTDRIIGVHLDLKYVMPGQQYLHRWVRQLPGWGVNTLLLEYEDKFPFEKHAFLRGEAAFTPDELREFLAVCRRAGLRVVPLVQTLAHLEFALAHPHLAHLRERPDVLFQINPESPAAVEFIHDLFNEVLAYHTEDEFFHIGGDEAWHLGQNPESAAKLARLGPIGYWAQHMRKYIDQVRAAGKRAWVWDDCLWKEPERIRDLDLPKDTVFVSWNYNATSLNPDGSTFARVEHYRRAGYEVLGAPCLNWGLMTPRHQHCLDNTAAWAQKVREANLQGIVNTAWACFHVLPHTQPLYIAATARALDGGKEAIGPVWQRQFLANHFQTPAEDVPDALEKLGTLWEQPVGLERPISPILFSYMDMILGYPRGQADRIDCGAYPLDWQEIDTGRIYRQKCEYLERCAQQSGLRGRIDELQGLYGEAAAVLQRLADRANDHQPEARFLAAAANAKLFAANTLRQRLWPLGDGQGLRDAGEKLWRELEACLCPFVDGRDLWRPLHLWRTPAIANPVLRK